MAYDFPAPATQDQEFTPPGGPTYIYKPPKWMIKEGGSEGGDGGTEVIDWAEIDNVPATFPPTLPIPSSGVTGLDSKQASQDTAINTKLASSAYTAADVLTKLKTVDGAGSGLDADLLDGITSTGYLKSANPRVESGYFEIKPHSATYNDGSKLQSYWNGNARTWMISARDSANAAVAATLSAGGFTITGVGPVAPLMTPIFTGNPQAPTPDLADTSTRLATTEFVRATVTSAVDEVPGGAAISDTPPEDPVEGQLWWKSDTGNTYIFYDDGDSAQWVQQNINKPSDLLPELDHISSEAADLRAMFRTGPNAFVINDKADGSGTNQMALLENGDLTIGGILTSDSVATGSVNASGAVTSGSAYFHSTGANVVLATGGSGAVYLRPNGWNSDVGQAYVDGNGNLVTKGFNYANTYFISTAAAAVLGTGSSAGACYLRPQGHLSSAGQLTLNASGQVSVWDYVATTYGSFYSADTYYGRGFFCRAGYSGGNGNNRFNFWWNGQYTLAYIDDSYMGALAYVSDYRIKKDVAPLPSTWEAVKALKPVSYTFAEFTPPRSEAITAERLRHKMEMYAGQNFIPEEEMTEDRLPAEDPEPPLFTGGDVPQWGLIAHEVQETLLPSAVFGEKDMLDGVQSLNLPAIVAALTKALQEAMARIETLEARVP